MSLEKKNLQIRQYSDFLIIGQFKWIYKSRKLIHILFLDVADFSKEWL